MIMRYCPPFIFAHRCYLTREENELGNKVIEAKFGPGGSLPGQDHRWFRGQTRMDELERMGISKDAYGLYYGFRTRDDQMLFYMTFEGQLGRK